MTNQSTKDRDIPDKSPKTDFTIPYLPSESIFKSKHEKTVQMETDFSAANTRNSNSDFLGPRNYKATVPRCITASENGSIKTVLRFIQFNESQLDSEILSSSTRVNTSSVTSKFTHDSHHAVYTRV